MVPSALRPAGLALLTAASALFAFPALRQGVDTERAEARVASADPAPQPELKPVRLLAHERPVGAAEPTRPARKKAPAYTVARVRAGHSVKLRAKPGGSTVA